MKKYIVALTTVVAASTLFATDARIESMGGQSDFYKDDYYIFTNPAAVADYSKMLMGSFGIYTAEPSDPEFEQYNRDAKKPYFGGTYSWQKDEAKKNKFTLGALFNRYDPLIRYVTPGDEHYIGDPKNMNDSSTIFIDSVVGKIDLLTGFTLRNGITLGLGGYIASQSQKEHNNEQAMTRVAKGTIGLSGKVSDNTELQASVAIAALTLNGYDKDNISRKASSADNDIAVQIEIRSFTDMPKINGAFVPHIQANILNHHTDETLLDFNGGIGFNSYIDRGFFWGSFEGIYQNDTYAQFSKYHNVVIDSATYSGYGKRSRIGGRVSFGIERNVLTDWLVWRVGGTKLLAYEKLDEGNLAGYWVENPSDDQVSFGMGVNIEDRLKVDAVVAENMLYTFTNLFSGNSHHFSTKISATFSF